MYSLINKLQSIGDYKDSESIQNEIKANILLRKEEEYRKALALAEFDTYDSLKEALSIINNIQPYKDCDVKSDELNKKLSLEQDYNYATTCIVKTSESSLKKSMQLIEALKGYKDSIDKYDECLCAYEKLIADETDNECSASSLDEAIVRYENLIDANADGTMKHYYHDRIIAHKAVSALIKKRDSLVLERDSMSGLFKAGKQKRINLIIEDVESRLQECIRKTNLYAKNPKLMEEDAEYFRKEIL